MRQFQTTANINTKISDDFFRLEFPWPSDAPVPLPGQFVTIRSALGSDPLLRRPFAVASFNDGIASIIYQKRGKATSLLSGLSLGESFSVIGPLGQGFRKTESLPVLIAGGIGLGPIAFLASQLGDRAPIFILGARTKAMIPDLDFLSPLSPVICTDDGTLGFHGTVIDWCKASLRPDQKAEYFACGPNAMLKALHQFAQSRQENAQVSLEQTMGCGVGACMGCTVEVNDERRYARVCKEGPVFDSKEIKWT
jgi:dihydroorotate dehydrogenase electron transfer subunit